MVVAAGGLADQPEDLPGADAEADAPTHRLAGVQRQAKVLYPDHRRRCHLDHAVGTVWVAFGTYHRPRLRAMASPVRLMPIVSSAIMAAGASTAQTFSNT